MKEFQLEPGEHIVKKARKHWFIFIAELLPYAIISIMPFAFPKLLSLVPSMESYVAFFDYNLPIMRVALGIWLLVTWTIAWGVFTRYFLNVWIVTNQRIVDIKQNGFFHREVSSLLLQRVQDATTDVQGVISSLLDIGDIKVQTAGSDVEFVMSGIPHPEQMRDIILKCISANPKNTGI